MKILFLSFYYYPDLSAGSFRSSSLINALLNDLPQNIKIDLITSLPNRYEDFKTEAPELEVLPRILIKRIRVPSHSNGKIDQFRVFLSFAKFTLKFIKYKDYDLVYATSGRLMTAFLGALIARKIHKPLYLDIRDIFVDTISDILPKILLWMILPIFNAIEKFTFNSANKINLVSSGFLPYFRKKYPKKRYSIFTNGIDEEFIFYQKNSIKLKSRVLTVVYAGNFGDGQGLHKIIPKLAKNFEGKLKFKLVGNGSKKNDLEKSIELEKCENVEIISPVKRSHLINLYNSADILFLHLNDYPAFKKVLPSKIFEYGALGKPIWAGVAGYSAKFVNKNIENVAVFKPGNVQDAKLSFNKLKMITHNRTKFIKKFSRKNIMKKMAVDIISLTIKNKTK